jgi:hypothetical protein
MSIYFEYLSIILFSFYTIKQIFHKIYKYSNLAYCKYNQLIFYKILLFADEFML